VIADREEQFLNNEFSIEVTPFGIETVVNDEQPLNADAPIVFKTPFASKVIAANDEQPLKADAPIEVTVFGIETVVKRARFSNAEAFIEVMLLGIVIFPTIALGMRTKEVLALSYNIPS
jgi:hypothetical protein